MRESKQIILALLLLTCLTVMDAFAQSNVVRDSLNVLDPAMVSADSRFIKQIISRTLEAKSRNNPEFRPHYDCEIYSRNEFDLVNPHNPLISKFLPKGFHFVYDYVETSPVSGLPYLPVMLAESKSHYFHSRSPELKKEVIESSRISGINEEKTVAQFTGGLYIKANFYENYLNIFQVEIPSPLAETVRCSITTIL